MRVSKVITIIGIILKYDPNAVIQAVPDNKRVMTIKVKRSSFDPDEMDYKDQETLKKLNCKWNEIERSWIVKL